MFKLVWVIFIWSVFIQSSVAENQIFKSKEIQTGLLELYTSEGCSSCPPADRWLSKLKGREDLWTDFVPMAFHVDYWDYIGWQDRFASPDYSKRQRLYAMQQSLNTIYTPGFIYDGKEWRNWRIKRFLGFPEGKMPGVLEVSVMDDTVNYSFKPNGSDTDDLLFNIALLGFDISTDVKRGENAGRELTHDFVVLNLKKATTKFSNGAYHGKIKLPESAIKAPRYGIAAWLNNRFDLSPIQAVGGYLN